MPPPRYPSDLSDQEWAILEPLLSRVGKGAVDRPGGLHAGLRTPCSTCSGAAARGGCSRESTHPGRRSTTISAGGGSTDGSAERMTDCAKRCARRRDATATLDVCCQVHAHNSLMCP